MFPFQKKRPRINPEEILKAMANGEPETIEPLTPAPEPIKVEIKQEETDFVTTDAELVFILQDRFMVKNVYFNKETGAKTFEFSAKQSQVEQFLQERGKNDR